METDTSMSESQPSRAFYLPATAILSPVPGRIERYLRNLVRDRSRLTRGPTTPEPIRAFYLPGTAIHSNVPGRVERFVAAHRRDRGDRTRAAALGERAREFYLPATFRR